MGKIFEQTLLKTRNSNGKYINGGKNDQLPFSPRKCKPKAQRGTGLHLDFPKGSSAEGLLTGSTVHGWAFQEVTES